MDTKSESRISAAEPIVATRERLREVGVFGGMSDDMLENLLRMLKPMRVATGECVFREGEAARAMYVLLDGALAVLQQSRQGRVAILGPSDCFGEMSIIDLQPRSATVRALSPVHLLRVSTEDMDAIYRTDLKAYAMLVLNIARDISRRLRVADALVTQVTATILHEYVDKTP